MKTWRPYFEARTQIGLVFEHFVANFANTALVYFDDFPRWAAYGESILAMEIYLIHECRDDHFTADCPCSPRHDQAHHRAREEAERHDRGSSSV